MGAVKLLQQTENLCLRNPSLGLFWYHTWTIVHRKDYLRGNSNWQKLKILRLFHSKGDKKDTEISTRFYIWDFLDLSWELCNHEQGRKYIQKSKRSAHSNSKGGERGSELFNSLPSTYIYIYEMKCSVETFHRRTGQSN